jgi:hypothetical protein
MNYRERETSLSPAHRSVTASSLTNEPVFPGSPAAFFSSSIGWPGSDINKSSNKSNINIDSNIESNIDSKTTTSHTGRRHANYSRCVGLVAAYVTFWIWFTSVRQMYDPTTTTTTTTKSAAEKSIGQQIVEASYRTSGFEDFANDFCPRGTPAEVLPSRFQKDFVIDCLQKAKLAGNTPGTKYHDRWPWWFRTLLRDLVGGDGAGRRPPELVGPWHYLQFKEVGDGGTAADVVPENGSREGSTSLVGESAPRLQLCVYEKGGTKSWKKLQCDHNHDYYRNAESAQEKRPDFNQCFSKQPPYDEKLLLSGSGSSNTTSYKSEKAVFLRDPLDRFLSGFLDKCVSRGRKDTVDHCEPISVFAESTRHNKNNDKPTRTDDSTTPRSPIETMLWDKRRTFQAYVDTFPLSWNMHFYPQSFYCGGLYKTIDDYEFVGSMGEDFYRDLDAMQKRYPGLEPGMESIFKLSQKLSTKRWSNPNTNKGVETGAAERVMDYYTPHTVRRVLEYYAMDYTTLGLPIPKWAEEMLLQP